MAQRVDIRQAIEIFHILFLRQLGEKVAKNFFTLKGGCNLRFYFKSIRYSEDMDLDVHTIARETLKKNVSNILASSSLQQTLQSRGITISSWSAPKQTDTTQRWKASLMIAGSDVAVPTKIEFSRRETDANGVIEPIDPELIQRYALFPVLCQHYEAELAFEQKVNALIHRSETQARDIFDLELLSHSAKIRKVEVASADLEKAQENALTVSFDDFKGQVLAYLPAEYQEYYSSDKTWNDLVAKIVDLLERLKTAQT